jgi:hypothetical protein
MYPRFAKRGANFTTTHSWTERRHHALYPKTRGVSGHRACLRRNARSGGRRTGTRVRATQCERTNEGRRDTSAQNLTKTIFFSARAFARGRNFSSMPLPPIVLNTSPRAPRVPNRHHDRRQDPVRLPEVHQRPASSGEAEQRRGLPRDHELA